MSKNWSNNKLNFVIVSIIIVTAIVFETFQQLYFGNRYNLIDNISYFDYFTKQIISWMIWLSLSSILFWYIKKNQFKKLSIVAFLKYFLLVIFIVLVCAILVALQRLLSSDAELTYQNLFGEYLPFFVFQKAAIYTLGYAAMLVVFQFYFKNQQLMVKVEKLSELKTTNIDLYQKLSKSMDDKAKVLSIKVGNKHKIIPVEKVYWLEADDYCVKIHSNENTAYTMRSSLKSLQDKLDSNFMRVHRSAIVNMSLVKEFSKSQPPYLLLKNDDKIDVSRSNLKTVKEYFL